MHRAFEFITGIIRSAGAKGAWALVDQAVVSLGTFCVGLLLARHFEPSAYGAFAIILGILFFLNVVHNGLITYPLSVRGSTLSQKELGLLTGVNLVWTVIVSLPLAVGMGVAVIVIAQLSVAFWAILALFAWQFHETARRALMTHLRHRDLLPGDGMKFFGWAVTVAILVWTGNATLETVFGALAILSVFAGALQCWQVQVSFKVGTRIFAVASEAWRLGRLVLAGGILSFFTVQFFSWVLLFFHGIEYSAQYQAMVLVLGVLHPILFGMGSILIPAVSRVDQLEGPAHALKVGTSYGWLGAIAIVPYCAFVILAPELLLRLFFGAASPYMALREEIQVFAVTYLFIYVTQVLFGLLNGLRRVPASFVSQGAGAVTAIAIGIVLISQWGVIGASFAALSSYGVQVAVQTAYLLLPERLPWGAALSLDEPESNLT